MTSMPTDRREQTICAIAHLLVAHFELEARRRDPDAEGRGRVAGNGGTQEE
jgi:hypothetical protein